MVNYHKQYILLVYIFVSMDTSKKVGFDCVCYNFPSLKVSLYLLLFKIISIIIILSVSNQLLVDNKVVE